MAKDGQKAGSENAAEIEERLALTRRVLRGEVSFLKSVVSMDTLPVHDAAEIAFAGRSNVGKSSLINALLGRKKMARTSNTPGRTQQLNFFTLEAAIEPACIVDLPGYGYARASKVDIAQWTGLVKDYLVGRPNLRRAMLLIDARHGFKDNDREVMALLDKAAVSYLVVATKADKVKARELDALLDKMKGELSRHPAAFPTIIATSAEKKSGIDELRLAVLDALEGK